MESNDIKQERVCMSYLPSRHKHVLRQPSNLVGSRINRSWLRQWGMGTTCSITVLLVLTIHVSLNLHSQHLYGVRMATHAFHKGDHPVEPAPARSAAKRSTFFRPSQLSTEESRWRDRYYFFREMGYLLRPRYHPDWVPSWIGTTSDPVNCEDSIQPFVCSPSLNAGKYLCNCAAPSAIRCGKHYKQAASLH